MFGAVAATSVAGAAALGSLELVVLAGFGATVALVRLLRAGRLRASHRHLVGFLGGGRVQQERDAVLSVDGTRRVRTSPCGHGVRFEILADQGRRTVVSYQSGPTDDRVELEALPIEVRFARVHGRSLDPVCFEGSPPELGGPLRRHDPRWLRVSRFADGALVERLDADGRPVGDTWHPDLEAAREQIDAEYGEHAGPLTSRPPRWDEPSQRVWH